MIVLDKASNANNKSKSCIACFMCFSKILKRFAVNLISNNLVKAIATSYEINKRYSKQN